MKLTRLRFIRTLIPLLLLTTPLLDAQTLTTVNVTGIVNDPTGAVVPGAAVTITYVATTETTETRSTASDECDQHSSGRSVANQYAASLGGPLIKNKTVFFVNTEGLRYAQPSSGVVSVPSPQFQQYVLAHVPAAVKLSLPRFGIRTLHGELAGG